jgi:hypothetical protein
MARVESLREQKELRLSNAAVATKCTRRGSAVRGTSGPPALCLRDRVLQLPNGVLARRLQRSSTSALPDRGGRDHVSDNQPFVTSPRRALR